ncbi:LIM domain-binding protein 3-like [Plakobranchus ocellatus]|uniref:LIM domain-binding protein 3-like n=1 Tax=Plakobranchus ocellatus TaxID=259542 RepID=A0AAV4AHN9_9GAST|nr:LIM domain-binding protein 3-like [Plakobranchus ocellatus]
MHTAVFTLRNFLSLFLSPQSGLIINNVENEKEYLCNTNKLESFSNIVGLNPVVKTPAITYKGVGLTALALTAVNQFTVAFLGTQDGRIKKVILKNKDWAHEYSEEVVSKEGDAILPDLHYFASQRALYVLTATNVTRLSVESCERADSCTSCLADEDPFCGWCFFETKCKLRESCPVSEEKTAGLWLQGAPSECVYIREIQPRMASVNRPTRLVLEIAPTGILPPVSSYSCAFPELSMSTPATLLPYGAACTTRDFRELGLSLGREPYKMVTVALNSGNTPFVTDKFVFYNCTNFDSCSSCTNSSFSCDWCVYDNACYDDTRTCQQKGIVRGKNSFRRGVKGPQHCPQIDTKVTQELYFPVGVKRTILLKGYNIPELEPKIKNYECVLNFNSHRVVALAKRHDDRSITCDIQPLTYPESVGSVEANVSVYWGDGFWLESTTPLTAIIYKCDVLASNDCSMCVNLNYTRQYLECYWCQGSCVYATSCKQPSRISATTCPAPNIDSVWPLSGPIQGGTNITIEGSNLGAKFDDIERSITVANVRCRPFRSLYQPSKRIVCQTSWRGQIASGPVEVKMGKLSARFSKSFKYKNPIRVYFDEQEYTLNRLFTYKEDPVINGIAPLESILAGGRMLTVTGNEFLAIQKPRMFAYVPSITSGPYPTNTTLCQVMNNRVMKCPTPPYFDSLKNIIRSRRSTPGSMSYLVQEDRARASSTVQHVQVVELAFLMDDVQSVKNLSGLPNLNNRLKYFPNPQVPNFTESGGVKVLKGDALIIEGSNLNLAAEQSEVSVMIGESPCNVTTFSQSQIVCKLPVAQPAGETTPGGDKDQQIPPWVKVKINNLEFYVGRVEYDVPEKYSFPTEAIIAICIIGGALLLIIIIILIIYRRKSTKAERIYRKLQIQLDNLESNVRNECKQAFAELQTDMTDLTGDLISSGIPFWDFHSYTFKVLFPGMSDHIILHPPIQKNGRFQFSDHGLQLFHQLLGKKLFMTTFIKTLEDQRSFSIRDRANVASLLMIVYLNNMEYATDILKCLLVDLVQKSVEGRHPKLMLRRSESVVEKLLTNWLSVCLYKYLRDYAGASLFMLYKAIKLQAEKGPVDSVTGDARYSLSEDTLLREKIECRMLTLNIESGTCEIFQVRVPDCDTITQTKEKILDHLYKNIPFSQRPPIRDLELEWRNGPTGPLLLSNLDIASYNKEGWRRLNTLAFYRVHDGAYMTLLHRQSTLKSMNGSLDNSVLSIGSVSPILKKEEESGFKEWHLVKHDDTLLKDGGVKMISEIFLTRLLSTKGTLQKYIDDFFRNMLSASPFVPPVVKYLFDFLDHQAETHGISDHEVVHTWKCNSLPLRFWVNIIKNPDFVFDINKPRIVDSCLSVVAQTFMDSCSTSEHRLGKDSPSNKLLFAKDIAQYRKLVEKYFTDVRDLPPLSEQEMSAFLADISRTSPKLFYISSALGELYKYVSKYKNELMEALEQDNQAKAMQLSCKLGHVVTCMEGPSGNMAYV